MDKYDEWARKLVDNGGRGDIRQDYSAIAAALRESAAQAYEDAANMSGNYTDRDRMRAKAAALREDSK